MKLCLACKERFDGEPWRCPRCQWQPETRDGYLCFAPDLAEGNDGFSAEYFGELARLEAAHFWFRQRNRLLIWALRRYFPGAQSFLEIGAGTGFVLAGIREASPHLQVYGCDIFTEALTFAGGRLAGVPLVQVDARRLPFEEEYDVIGAFDILEHIERYDHVFREIFRACRPGGGALITVPQHRFLWSALDEYSFHKRRFVRAELLQAARQAGFGIVRVTSFVSLLFPLLVLSRLGKRRMRTGFDPRAELRLHPAVNRILEGGLALERVLIQQGCSFPFGGSLLLVARREAA
jgi:SAM-dependent methyltransferase